MDVLEGLPVRLTKMGSRDEPEVFLVTFERVATAACWPPKYWTTLLAPYLTSSTQTAYRNLDPREALDYACVKAAILHQTGITLEIYQQWFCNEPYPPGAQPRVMAQHL